MLCLCIFVEDVSCVIGWNDLQGCEKYPVVGIRKKAMTKLSLQQNI